MNAAKALIPLSLWALAVLPGCPDPPKTPPDVDADALTAEPDGDADGTGSELPSVECTTAADCEAVIGDAPVCKQLACVSGQCGYEPAANGSTCPSGLCGGAATCEGGECVATGNACDDGNPCTSDQCDPQFGCANTNIGSPCDDGDACTADDHCANGDCQGVATNCDDNNACTDDVCNPVTGVCEHADNTDPCDDGDACTDGDTCAGGVCVSGPPLDCDDGEACTDEVCDSVEGCKTTILDGACDDGNACTDNESCKDGQCLGDLVTCNDGNLCTSDYCDPASGCVFTNNMLGCDDGDPCTLKDVCSEGECVSGPIDPLCCDDDAQCDDADACTDDACVDGYCQFVPLDCDDGWPCTIDTCDAGLCAHEPFGAQPGGPVLEEGFEGTLDGWTVVTNNVDATWQIDTSDSHSGAASLYCGNTATYTYDGIGTVTATVSRTVQLPPTKSVDLSFWLLQDLDETGSCNYDVTRVKIDGQVVEPAMCDTVAVWTEQTYDLTAWAGQTVSLEIGFDTVDGALNDGMGVWIDDIAITTDVPEGCCDTTADCAPGGTGCMAEVCHPEGFECLAGGADACDDGDPCTADVCDADTGDCSHEAIAECCVQASECPGDPGMACAVATCFNNACGLDTSGCCTAAGDCPEAPEGACAVASCNAGTCEYDTSACCTVDEDCTVGAACEQATCDDGTCAIDASLCCSDAGECPEAPEGPCAVASCPAGTCEYDTSGCP